MHDDFDPNIFDPNYDPSNPYYAQYQAGQFRSYKWHEVWTEATLRPSVQTFWQLVNDPLASMERALSWLIIVVLIGSAVSLGVQLFLSEAYASLYGFDTINGQEADVVFGPGESALFSFVCCLPFTIAIYLVLIFINMGIVHASASLMGGKGQFEKLVYGFASFAAPLWLFSSLVSLVPCIGLLIGIFLLFYYFALMAIMVKAVYLVGWVAAIVSAIMPTLLVFGLCFCCVAGTVSLSAA
ncbi:MAG: hypothetical protein GYB66_16325 [Chloroflexi bacterium]|nr:hypothetical protein [Chloroflexota bacterium]